MSLDKDETDPDSGEADGSGRFRVGEFTKEFIIRHEAVIQQSNQKFLGPD